MNNSSDDKLLKPSKSQIKREIDTYRHLAKKLVELATKDINKLDNETLVQAVLTAKKVSKGNARKRLIQHITKTIKSMDVETIQRISELVTIEPEASNFHQLETWREQLLTNTAATISEISILHPQMDRQALRHLIKQTIREQETGRGDLVYYRKIFQFLKSLAN